MLDHWKDDVNLRLQKRVYFIPCSCGKQYIVETGRSFQVRLNEHSNEIRHNWTKILDLSKHLQDIGHNICIEDTKIIAKLEHYGKGKYRRP